MTTRSTAETRRGGLDASLHRAGTDRQAVLDILGERPRTCDAVSREMAERHGRPDRPNQYAATVLGLRKQCLVVDAGVTQQTRMGNPAVVWRLATDVEVAECQEQQRHAEMLEMFRGMEAEATEHCPGCSCT